MIRTVDEMKENMGSSGEGRATLRSLIRSFYDMEQGSHDALMERDGRYVYYHEALRHR